jgi:hypothetical protein
MTDFEFTADEPYSSGSTPTDAYQALNTLLTRTVIEAARRRQGILPGLTELFQDSVLVTSGGTSRRAYGWFEADAWRHEDRPAGELFVNAAFDDSEPGVSPAENVFTTLLHEACHVYANANGIKDTSRDGRYHNRRFGELALQLGLQVEKDERIGLRTRTLSAQGRADFGDLLGQLERGLIVGRASRSQLVAADENTTDDSSSSVGTPPPASSSRYVFASCGCRGARGVVTLRVARGSWRAGVIRCGACDKPFRESLTPERQARPGGA